MDAKAVQRILETFTKTTAEFCEAEMRQELQDCKNNQVMSYQHQGEYLEVSMCFLDNAVFVVGLPIFEHN